MKQDKTPQNLKSKYTAQQYKFICELIWGGVPVDRKNAEESSLFKDIADKILEKYPKLDISFFEEHNTKKTLELDGDMVDEIDDDDDVGEFLRSNEFKESFRKQVEKDTWGKGLPMVYMNDEGKIVKHWADGNIEVIKEKAK